MNELMTIWDHAKKTDPSATKKSKVGGYESTSINGYWFFEKATELWGACGTGWGYEVVEERFDQGGPIFNADGVEIAKTCAHTIKLNLWYGGDKSAFVTAYGHTPWTYQTRNGITTDMEAPKKSLTDAIKKALSMLGFGSDVFMGEFDDQLYVEEREREEAIEKAIDKDAEADRQKQEWITKAKSNIATMVKSEKLSELKSIYKAIMREALARNDEAAQKRIDAAYTKRLEELKEAANG